MRKESLQKALLVVSVVVLAVVGAAVGLVMHLSDSLSQGPIGFFTSDDVDTLSSLVETTRALVVQNKSCLMTVDETSIGDKNREAQMSYVVDMLRLYRLKFGSTAQNLTDLERLLDPREVRPLEKECFLYIDPTGATVVSCGGEKPSRSDLEKLVSSDEYVQRFYEVGDSEVLYIPAERDCPPPSTTSDSGSIR